MNSSKDYTNKGMVCPACRSDRTFVADSRANGERNVIRRRRACKNCDHRFTTYELDGSLYDETVRREGQLAKLRDVAVAALQQIADTVPAPEPEPRSDECV